LNLIFLDFEFVSCFDIRASNFWFIQVRRLLMTGALMMWVVEKGSAEGRNLYCIIQAPAYITA
jgi:hypothetical protein